MDTADISEVTIGQILFWSAIIALAALVAYLVYRSMDHPRLVLVDTPQGQRATVKDTVQYAVSMPILILLWWAFFFCVLFFNGNDINAAQLLIFPSALIVAIRTLAYAVPPAARELAKVIPIALIAIVILDGNVRNSEEGIQMFEDVARLNVTTPALLFLFLWDYMLTALWYWGWIRWLRPLQIARVASAKQVAHDDGGVAVLTDADGADGRA